ncbi:helix-turn-helix domain-containing protein [Nonomuraea sp. NPDC050394]|uniref:helix-turn-helix domain-containing protein n=1 Tax=Nonomuraea sp. NPDC050394 TaxID=3364363 RepID=UPI0037A09F0C
MTTPPLEDLRLYDVNEAKEILNLSRATLYRVMQSGRLRTVHEGRACRITAAAIRDYIALLEQEAAA